MASVLTEVLRFENALPLPLFEAVAAMAVALADSGAKGTFWQELGEERTVAGAAASKLSRLLAAAQGCCGVEWWVRLKPSDMPMQFHFDKDESLFRLTGRMRHPLFAGVLYLTDTGGPTLIIDQAISSDGQRLLPHKADQAVLSHPRQNCFVMFPGHLRHGIVTDRRLARGCSLAGNRGSVLLNWWQERPLPPGCQELPASLSIRFEMPTGNCTPRSCSPIPVARDPDLFERLNRLGG